MNIYLNIEKLITYAKIHLLLDEADEIYVRNLIMQKLELSEYIAYEVDEEEIEGYENPFAILDNLFAYAQEKGICKEEDRKLFNAQLMDIVSLRPGEMADTFESLSKNQAKALEWAFDYAVKNGSAITDFHRWENKGDKNLEVVFAGCCGAKDSYPGCCLCLEGEGYGVHQNERYIPLSLGDGDWYYKAAKRAYVDGLGNIVKEHKPLEINEDALNIMFDFVEATPGWYICTGESEKTAEHAHFVCGSKLLPIHKANDKRKFKSKDYPYINIVETDWYLSLLKLSCTNREKLIEFTLKLIEAYKKNDGKVFISLRKIESKFTVEIAFMRGEAKKEHSALSSLDLYAMAGIFRIGGKVEEQLKTIEKYLTKEIRFTPMCLVDGMEAHAKMIDRLLKEVGTSQLGAVEAALDVKEECKKTLVAFLNDIRAYDEDGMAAFLQAQEISLVK
ncbi:MAG: hypothetical protein J1F36_01690 [Clostridiales bacterium]|nr:hypothetical protein [Clostridiales bacterium]